MAKTFEEIKKKYAEAVRARKVKIANAQNKVERLKTMVEYYKEMREKYRQGRAPISAETAEMWNSYTATITRLNEQLAEAERLLAECEIGAVGLEILDKEIQNM